VQTELGASSDKVSLGVEECENDLDSDGALERLVVAEDESVDDAGGDEDGEADGLGVPDGLGVLDGLGVPDGLGMPDGLGVSDGLRVPDGLGVPDGLKVADFEELKLVEAVVDGGDEAEVLPDSHKSAGMLTQSVPSHMQPLEGQGKLELTVAVP